ncbi:hypothetical protein [Polyangium spumosum]|uniref:Uncharacterized protein n=1 Tax=Polyangium spumosum TaxID=889282 RepID=A0A6N7QBJ5_9BACT|nr:hypothetical protein [Polyangium spumosum]MRG98231.1 hypothetical protein [Polyangium spumosum]
MPKNDLATARAELAAKLTHALNEALAPSAAPAPIVLVDAPGGLGKSHITARLLQHRRVTWFGERNRLLGAVEGYLSTPLLGVVPLPPATTTAVTSNAGIEKRPSREDEGFCSQFDKRIKPLQMFGLGRFEQRMGCKLCPDRDTCKYQNWRPSKPWLFASHARLGLRNDDKYLFEGREIVVIDESPVKEVLQAVTLEPYEIHQILSALKAPDVVALGELSTRAFTQLFEVVSDLLDDPPPNRRRIELRVLLRELGYVFVDGLPRAEEQIRAAARLLAGQPEGGERERQNKDMGAHVCRIDPMSTAYLIQKLEFIGGQGLGAKLHKLADALAADTGARPTCVLVLPSGESRGGIIAGQRVIPPVPPQVPIVILDATCDQLLYAYMFPDRPLLHVHVEAQQTARIIQTIDYRYPASTLGDPNSPSINRLMDIVDKYKAENPGHKIAVIVQKHLFAAKPQVKKRILESVKEEDVAYFWSNRGENALKDYDALFVLGAPELHPLEIEARARAYISTEPPASWEDPFDYRLVPSPNQDSSEGYVVADDGTRLIERRFRRGPFSVFWAFHQAEYAQSMLRLRPYDPHKKKTIYFFSNVDIPYFVIERKTEDELLGRKPDLLLRARDALMNERAAGRQGIITQKDLADLLRVSKVAITKAKKKYGRTGLWREIEVLLGHSQNATAGSAGASGPSS